MRTHLPPYALQFCNDCLTPYAFAMLTQLPPYALHLTKVLDAVHGELSSCKFM
jgi:hypothetical protein